ncbi:MAG: TIGR03943 family protein [Cyanobacteriota bacterium]|nr:TIGR03943 family protein [Cyanobacteriota bacterium]
MGARQGRGHFLKTLDWQSGSEALALLLLGVLLLSYRLGNQLFLVVQKDFIWAVTLTGCLLLTLGCYRIGRFWQGEASPTSHPATPLKPLGGWLLIATCCLGFWIPPQPLSGQTALNRGVAQNLGTTRYETVEFRPQLDPAQRSLIDWVRLLNAYPDPQTYVGQPVNLKGFVVHPESAPPNQFWITRFLISCCAADAYPVGLPVHWSEGESLPADSWQMVQGRMTVETIAGSPQLVIQAENVTPMPTPTNPYDHTL